ncbi:putative Thioredoxin [uncultured archaeon]|nr:putative Thioredoxin [uncultured archaeon]
MAYPVTLEVFSTKTCPHCPAAIKLAGDVVLEFAKLGKQVDLKIVDLRTPEGKERAAMYGGITATPTLFAFSDESKTDRVRMVGVPPRDALVKGIKLASGELLIPTRSWWSKAKDVYVTKPVEETLEQKKKRRAEFDKEDPLVEADPIEDEEQTDTPGDSPRDSRGTSDADADADAGNDGDSDNGDDSGSDGDADGDSDGDSDGGDE